MVPDFVARQTERMAESLAYFLTTMSEEQLRWRPEAQEGATTRSALDQISECVTVNRYMAELIRNGAIQPPPGGWPDIAFQDAADAQAQLRESARELAEALRAMTPEDMARDYQHPRAVIRGENLLLMCYRNMAYHAGQINFIQTLYGDTEFHVPPTWR
jgi:hypothetical protein